MNATSDTAAPASRSARPGRFARILAPLGLAAVVLGVYLRTLAPGVGAGDVAELQFVAPQLGICHPPGYPLVVCAGYLAAQLPVGPSIAWRVNLLMGLSATLGCLALYGTLARITGRVLPGIVGAATLAWSSVYWMHAIEAEVYAFYAMLLLVGVYCATRFFLGGRSLWLILAAAALGACVSNRVSEVFVLPAFVVAWVAFRRTARLSGARVAIASGLFLLPAAFTLGFHIARQNPAALYLRDNLLRDALIEPTQKTFAQFTPLEKLADAISYSLALKWQNMQFGPTRAEQIGTGWQFNKLGWLLSGAGALGDRYPVESEQNRWFKLEQGRGAAIGAPALALALLGIFSWRRQWGWPALGGLLIAGNLAFYLWHRPPDNIEFIVPLLAGLSLLAGLGAALQPGQASSPAAQRRRSAFATAALLAPLCLLLGNWRVFAADPEATRAALERARQVVASPLPENALIIAGYERAMTYRYLLHLEARRSDISIVISRSAYTPQQIQQLFMHFHRLGRPMFVPLDETVPAVRDTLAKGTDPAVLAGGLLRFRPLPRPGVRPNAPPP